VSRRLHPEARRRATLPSRALLAVVERLLPYESVDCYHLRLPLAPAKSGVERRDAADKRRVVARASLLRGARIFVRRRLQLIPVFGGQTADLNGDQ